jgi:hypothetical protein
MLEQQCSNFHLYSIDLHMSRLSCLFSDDLKKEFVLFAYEDDKYRQETLVKYTNRQRCKAVGINILRIAEK